MCSYMFTLYPVFLFPSLPPHDLSTIPTNPLHIPDHLSSANELSDPRFTYARINWFFSLRCLTDSICTSHLTLSRVLTLSCSLSLAISPTYMRTIYTLAVSLLNFPDILSLSSPSPSLCENCCLSTFSKYTELFGVLKLD